MFAEFLTAAVLAASLAIPLPTPPFSLQPCPSDLVDAELDPAGNLYLLRSGTPHLEVRYISGETMSFDLPEVVLPGGLSLEDRWGWWVSDEIGGVSYRYDDSGVVVDSIPTPGRPGDLCELGFSIMYVSRDRGALMNADSPVHPVLRFSGAGLGQLTASSSELIYSDGSESFLLPVGGVPISLSERGTRALAAGTDLLLRADSIFTDTWVLDVSTVADFTRISSSPGGQYMVLWSPGGEGVLLLR